MFIAWVCEGLEAPLRMWLIALLCLQASPAVAQDASVSAAAINRTPDVRPDLQGVWYAYFITPMERPDGVTSLIVAEDEASEVIGKLSESLEPGAVYDPDLDHFIPDSLLSVGGELRSSWVVQPADGRLPFTTLAQRFAWKSGFDNPEDRPGAERCVSGLGHAPLRAISFVIPHQIVQTPEAILIVTEDIDPGRIIDMTGRSTPSSIRTRAGYSRGRWDGDTLVVETDHFAARDPKGLLTRESALLSEGSRVVERFRLLSPNEILYQFTVEDPALYSEPWLAEYTLKRGDQHVYEYACHEGNSSMVSILRAARMGRQTNPVPTSAAPP
jgi:hypothetical protein